MLRLTGAIGESEVQRANLISAVRRDERSDSGVRVQRAFSVFLKNLSILFLFWWACLLVFDFFILKNERVVEGEFHFSKTPY